MRAETLARASAWRICVAAVVFIAFSAGAACARGAITGVNVANRADRVVITVQGDSALSMTPLLSKSGSYLGFQFPMRLATKGRLVGIRSGRIYNVRYSCFKPNPPTTRVVVNTRSHVDYSTRWSPDRRRVEIHVMKLPALTAARSAAASNRPTASQEKAMASAVTSAETPQPVLVASIDPIAAAAVAQVDPLVEAPAVRVLGVTEVKTSDPQQPPAAEPAASVRNSSAETRTPAPRSTRPRLLARSIGATAPAPSVGERKVSLNFLGADINDVLKALSVQSGHNIVAGKDVTGNVTVSLNNVTVEEALDYVAKLSGYSYTKDNDTYLVASKENLGTLAGTKAEDSVVEILSLRYINVDEALALLKSQYPQVQASKVTRAAKSDVAGMKSDQVLAEEANNAVVLLGARSKVEAAKTLIAKLDESMKSQSLEEKTAIYHVKYVNVAELAKTLMSLVPGIKVALAPSEGFNMKAPADIMVSSTGSRVNGGDEERGLRSLSLDDGGKGSSGASIAADTKSQALIIIGRDADVEKAKEIAAQLDVRFPQVKIDAKITSLTESAGKKLGISWDWGQIGLFEAFTDFNKATYATPQPTDPGGLNLKNVADARGQWVRQPFDLAGTLDAIITSGDGQLLASPSLVCLEGKPGVFFVGDEVTYIQRIEVTPTGQNIITDTKQVGVQLRVIGNANDDGYITLNLHPEVSVLKLKVDRDMTLPIVTRRFTDHVVRVKNGDTIVIGGLIRNDEIMEMSKVPLLGDLPVLGNLFRHKEKGKDRTEVVMFITASLLKD